MHARTCVHVGGLTKDLNCLTSAAASTVPADMLLTVAREFMRTMAQPFDRGQVSPTAWPRYARSCCGRCGCIV
jgi:hypothetical protein